MWPPNLDRPAPDLSLPGAKGSDFVDISSEWYPLPERIVTNCAHQESTDIATRMGKLVRDFGAHTSKSPEYIYLGREESFEFAMWAMNLIAECKARHDGKVMFMGAEVIAVDKPSHLAVGE